jgi:hypothetical protein
MMVAFGEGTQQSERYKSPMATSTDLMIIRSQRDRAIDVALNAYVDWREECIHVWSAYDGWVNATRADSGLAFLAYLAALDREARAAEIYAGLIGELYPRDATPSSAL